MWYLIALLSALATPLVQSMQETNEIGSAETNPPTWGYKCEPQQGCQQIEAALDVKGLHESMDICRLVCGEFGSMWPKPTSAALGSKTLIVHPNYLSFNLTNVSPEARPLLESMLDVFRKNILAECSGHVTEVVTKPMVINLHAANPSLVLDWSTNEEYSLDINEKSSEVTIEIVAGTVYGARHALETLSQLVASNKLEFSKQKQCSLHMISEAKIVDKPAYKHRGLVLDSSRNFMPLSVIIMKTLDGMAASKLNVFHWHVTDTQSFSLESRRVPEFTKYGAYSESEIYSVEEVRELILYAQVRGIRVVIEIGAPAHAGNGWQWGPEYGLGDLVVCVNENNWRQYCIKPPCGQLNPANPAVFRVLKDLYKDIADFIPTSPLLHMGGNELFINCWNSSVEIVDYMRSKGMTTTVEGFMQLWGEFQAKALKAWDEATNKNEPVMIWSSELTNPIRVQKYLNKKRYIIQVWEPLKSSDLEKLLKLDYQVVASPKDVWFLDHGFWGKTKYSNWRRMYSHKLSNHKNVLGGEVAMWTEYVNANDLDTNMWPRAAAVAERLWSDPNSIDNQTEPRLQRLRGILIVRGLTPDAMSPGWCANHASKCK